MALIPCPECAREVSDQAASCPGCGVCIAAQQAHPEQVAVVRLPKSRMAYILLAIFLGFLGLHNFYAGFTGRGLFQLLAVPISALAFGVSGAILAFVVVSVWILAELFVQSEDSDGVDFN